MTEGHKLRKIRRNLTTVGNVTMDDLKMTIKGPEERSGKQYVVGGDEVLEVHVTHGLT